jgi:hypothetical protein
MNKHRDVFNTWKLAAAQTATFISKKIGANKINKSITYDDATVVMPSDLTQSAR